MASPSGPIFSTSFKVPRKVKLGARTSMVFFLQLDTKIRPVSGSTTMPEGSEMSKYPEINQKINQLSNVISIDEILI